LLSSFRSGRWLVCENVRATDAVLSRDLLLGRVAETIEALEHRRADEADLDQQLN
jgi:hypothetical protein